MKLSLMITCLGDCVRPEAGKAVVRILRQLGHTLDFPQDQTCCGQPMFNGGFADLAREQAKHTIRVFAGDQPVIVPSGSCAAMVKVEYPHLLEGDKTWHQRALQLAERTFEFSDFLVNRLKVIELGARYQGKVAYHYACHLRMLGQTSEVETLIRHVEGAEYVPIARQDQCCGFGGSFAIRYPQISGNLVDDKMRCILASGADCVVSTDAGCLMNIGGRLHREGRPIEVLHIAELLERR
ncbi:MAG TPA: (Fe-S)-binding protein [Pirellulaceae bacterium]|nr:(Fe-S)-binding protein [Pirellulaceae bacterium]